VIERKVLQSLNHSTWETCLTKVTSLHVWMFEPFMQRRNFGIGKEKVTTAIQHLKV
jgi:hypothetical protein